MKLKMTEHNGAMAVVVSGMRQDLIITEDDGGFVLEWVQKSCATPTPVPVPVATPVRVPVATPVPMPGPVSADIQHENQTITLLPPVRQTHASGLVPPASTAPADGAVHDGDLFKKLAALRKSLAAADKVPPYLIFHDKTLREMAEKMPTDMQAMGTIPGVGQAKLQKFGHLFLDVINDVAV